ncbi:hypothetical protein AOQ84DRAFT_184640 [Glonium stellatum]|uniref:Uncharacterized protein n=1 Tax=Glonium stellatum TaxID=574774 RepID=A0A8E2F6R4_9PEZI|nr:hypothetical protein AOQ84DRAFT_184640 [Glonium stellatum]
MHSLCNILLLLALPLAGSVLAQNQPKPSQKTDSYIDPNQAFQDLLNAVPEESLHAALHNHHPKFQDGVWEHDRAAVENVHREDPPLATRLILAAKIELAKRQASNGTSSAASAESSAAVSSAQGESSAASPASSAPATTSSAARPVVVPVSITTTDSAGKTTVASSSILSAPTVSVAVAVTTTNSAGSTFVSTSDAPGVVFTTTDSAGSTFVTTSPVAFAPTSGQVLTETDQKGSTFLTTYTPGGGTVVSILLATTHKPDGTPETLTSYAYVGASATEIGTAQQVPASGTQSTKPGLQTGAAGVLSRRWGAEAVAVVGGAVGVAWFI